YALPPLALVWTPIRTPSILLFTALSSHHSGHSACILSFCGGEVSARSAQLHRRNAPFRDNFHYVTATDFGFQLLPIRLSDAAKSRLDGRNHGLSGHLSAIPVHVARLDNSRLHPLHAHSVLRIRTFPRRFNLCKPLFLGYELALTRQNLTVISSIRVSLRR